MEHRKVLSCSRISYRYLVPVPVHGVECQESAAVAVGFRPVCWVVPVPGVHIHEYTCTYTCTYPSTIQYLQYRDEYNTSTCVHRVPVYLPVACYLGTGLLQ